MRRRMMGKDNRIFKNAYSVVHLDDKSNTDAKGNAIVWDSSPAATFGPGKFGNALLTSNCRIKVPVATNVNRPFTIACWVRASNRYSDGSYNTNCSVRVNPNNATGMLCYIGFNVGYHGAGDVRILLGNNYNWIESEFLLGKVPIDSNWHHLAFIYTGGAIIVYIDGVKSGSVAVGLDTMSNFSQIGIMSGSVSQIDEVIYTPEILYTENFIPPTKPYR